MNPLEMQFYWLAVTADAWGCFWGHMMEGARFIGTPEHIDFTNVVEIDFSRKGE